MGAPKRYSFVSEMDAAAKKWIAEYKKLFNEVAKYNAGNNVATNQVGVQSEEGKAQSAEFRVQSAECREQDQEDRKTC